MSQSKDEQNRKDENSEEKKKLKIDKKSISDLNEEEQEELEGGAGSRICSLIGCPSTYITVYAGAAAAGRC